MRPISFPVGVGRWQTRVIAMGDGPAVLLVHGLGARADRWQHTLPALAGAGYRAVAFDLPGHGFASKSPEFPFSVLALSEFTVQLADALELGPVAAVGTSIGGFVCAHLACEHPGRIDALVLVGTLGIVPMGKEARDSLAGRFSDVSRQGIERKLRAVNADPGVVTPEWVEEEWRINNSPGAAPAFAGIVGYLRHRIDDDIVGQRLAGMHRRPPMVLVWGREDRAVPLSVGEKASAVLGDCPLRIIDKAGHAPYLERAGAFNDILIPFLADNRGAAAS